MKLKSFGDLSAFTKAALLEKKLRMLKPGECARMYATELSDMIVPANPLDKQTPEYLANWFHSRMPFYCKLRYNVVGNYWEIDRVKETREPPTTQDPQGPEGSVAS